MSEFSTLREKYDPDHAQFWRYGYIVLRNVFSREEAGHLVGAVRASIKMNRHISIVREQDSYSAFQTIFVWNDTDGNDIFAKATRRGAILDRLRAFFDDDVYVYHNKVALKYPGVRGFQYHQDYGYWYDMGNLYPDMATAQIALEDSTIANGCLRVIPGSHRLGRLQHSFDPEVKDSSADRERLAAIRDRIPEVTLELAAGDVAIFHANTPHASYDNTSDVSRLALLGCYNTRHNNPFKPCQSGHPFYSHQPSIESAITHEDLGNLPDFEMRHD